MLPFVGRAATKRFEVVRYFQQIAALRAAVDRLFEVVFAVTAGNARERGSVFHNRYVHIVT
jgi:hypothetical protein